MNIKEILRAVGEFGNDGGLDETLSSMAAEQGQGWTEQDQEWKGFVELGFFCIVDSWNW